MRRHWIILSAAFLALPGSNALFAQTPDTARTIRIDPVTVTATRAERNRFFTPVAIGVIDSTELERWAAPTAVDLFRFLPGVDVTGVGTNQLRPMIRGQRGQRILLLKDGIRLNNSRRQQDFGEIPALVDVDGIDRVEVVRGPASVLYGTDAIGGAVNIITAAPPSGEGSAIHGSLRYRSGSADGQVRPSGALRGHAGPLRFGLTAAYRETNAYDAPEGRFGDLRLDRKTRVHDTGVTDESYGVQLGYNLGNFHDVMVEAERYEADDAGFGYVGAADYGRPDDPFIQILYPHQRVNRLTARYTARAIGLPFADRVSVTAYGQDNERNLAMNIFIPFGQGTPPGSGVAVASRNFTDLGTVGARVEAAKILGNHTLTYGVDAFQDRSRNHDVNTTTVVGFGPPQTETDSTPQVPNATFRSAGLFVQGELALAPRTFLTLGARYQDIKASTDETERLTEPLIESTDRTVVGTANLLVGITENFNLIGAVGRGFRSPNLVERFFQGPTPEGSGFQSRNPDLEPETSLNLEVGARYRLARLYLEGFVFRNTIYDGIRTEATGDSVGPFPEFRNVNLDKLRFQGFEVAADWNIAGGLFAGMNYTHLGSRDVVNPGNPVGESYADKLGLETRFASPNGRWMVAYQFRYQGPQKDIQLVASPVGTEVPSFSVHTARASARILETGRFSHAVSLVVNNIGNRLYAESANTSFFRPEPGRNVLVTWSTSF